MSNCTCQKIRIMAKETHTEALSSVEEKHSANTWNYLSSTSPREGSWSLGPGGLYHLPSKTIKSAHTQWLAQELHNLCLLPIFQIQAVLSLQNAIFKTSKLFHIIPTARSCCLTRFWPQSGCLLFAVISSWLRLIVPVRVSHWERMRERVVFVFSFPPCMFDLKYP